MAEPVEGVDPEQLDEQATAMEELIAAALAAVAAAAVAQVFIPGMPGVPNIGTLGVITDLWWPVVDEQLIPELTRSTFHAAETVRNGIGAAFARTHPPRSPRAITQGPAIPDITPISDVTAAEILAGARNRLVAIGNDLWANARASMVEGLQKGETIPELAARVQAAAGVTEPRSRVIARTEVIAANNAASIAQARSSGYTMNKIWQATEDPRTRLWHREADGQSVPDRKSVV